MTYSAPVSDPARRPLFFRPDGTTAIERRGLPRSLGASFATDLYHWLRTTSWTRLFGVCALLFFVTNLFFAAVLWFGDATIVQARPDSFWDRFYFSVQTLATIGYGYMAPGDALANWVVTIESFVGLMLAALITGIVFAKFSSTTAKVLWSECAVVSREDGTPTLQFRMANGRSAAIVEATVKLSVSWDETLRSGEQARRIYDLPLRRSTSPFFALSWTVFHVIDDRSPLHGLDAAALAERTASMLVTFTGIDDALATLVHARRSYPWTQIKWHRRFVDIIKVDEAHDVRYLDYTAFHDTEPDDAPRPG